MKYLGRKFEEILPNYFTEISARDILYTFSSNDNIDETCL